MHELETSSWLLSLPSLPLQTVIDCLGKQDKRSLATTCRYLATAVSTSSSETRLTVTSSTGWHGLSKILSTRTITCKTLTLEGQTPVQHEGAVDKDANGATSQATLRYQNALDVLLGLANVPGCRFPGIQRVCIDARPLRCLLPANIATLFPDLEELEIQQARRTFTDEASLQQLPYCSSLHSISYIVSSSDRATLQLPAQHHTAVDLQRQLPNIMSLRIKPARSAWIGLDPETSRTWMETMLNAWGSQLTELDINVFTKPPPQLPHCTRLKSLTWQNIRTWEPAHVIPVNSFPPCLTSLTWNNPITELQLQEFLLLPALHILSFLKLRQSLLKDWSQHLCTWHQLKVVELCMVDLIKLPLHSLKGETCLSINLLILPDPLLPSSMAHVERAAQCVSNANIMIGGLDTWICKAWEQPTNQVVHEVDAASVGLLLAASRVVQPPDTYMLDCCDVVNLPRTTAALFKWLSPTLQELQIYPGNQMLQPWFWQELQCCCKLKSITFKWQFAYPASTVEQYLGRICTLITQAAEHCVSNTHRSLKLIMYNQFIDSDQLLSPQKRACMVRQMLEEQLLPTIGLQECAWEDCHYITTYLVPRKLKQSLTLVSDAQSEDIQATTSFTKGDGGRDTVLSETLKQSLTLGSEFQGIDAPALASCTKANDERDTMTKEH